MTKKTTNSSPSAPESSHQIRRTGPQRPVFVARHRPFPARRTSIERVTLLIPDQVRDDKPPLIRPSSATPAAQTPSTTSPQLFLPSRHHTSAIPPSHHCHPAAPPLSSRRLTFVIPAEAKRRAGIPNPKSTPSPIGRPSGHLPTRPLSSRPEQSGEPGSPTLNRHRALSTVSAVISPHDPCHPGRSKAESRDLQP